MRKIEYIVWDLECDALLGLTSLSQDAAILNYIRGLLEADIDWLHLMELAQHHRVLPLLFHRLHQYYRELTPDDIYQSLLAHVNGIAIQNALFAAELARLIDYLNDSEIQSIPYKGPIAALVDYDNLALRQFSDLDLLVAPGNYQAARELLLTHGFQLAADWGWECSMVNDKLDVCVDLHRAITNDRFPVGLDFVNLSSRLRSLQIAGREIKILDPTDTLIILCIQLTKDANAGTNALRLSKVCDIGALLHKNQNMDWNLVYREAQNIGCRRLLSMGLNLAAELLRTPLPAEVLGRARADGPQNLFTEYVCCQLFVQNSEKNSATLSKEEFYFQVRERWRDKLYPRYWDFKNRLVPNEFDHAFLRLPDWLSGLYYIIRPVRLAMEIPRRLFKPRKSD